MFEAFYLSPWQQPAMLALGTLGSLFFFPRRSGFLRLYFLVFTLETLLDAFLTSSLFSFPPRLSGALSLAFVLLGDARLFLFVERMRKDEAHLGWVFRAALLTLPVPLAQAALIGLFPKFFETPRHTYLAYEGLFVLWLFFYRFYLAGRRELDEPRRTLLRRVCSYGLAYYSLWALADVVILAGFDGGFLLRVIPNLLYYSLFVPFVCWATPEERR